MSKLDSNFFKPFVDGTIHTLQVQSSIQAKLGKPLIKDTENRISYEIAAIIGLVSESVSGTIALCFKQHIFLGIMGKMLGDEFKEITPDIQDGAAELLNMIYGHAKRILNEQGYDFEKAIPTILRGKELEVSHLTSSQVIVFPFSIEGIGDFHVEMCTEFRNKAVKK